MTASVQRQIRKRNRRHPAADGTAIDDAPRKAEIYANASGVQLGRVEWITEDTSSGPPVPMMTHEAAAPVPIESGENTLRVRVTVDFNIGR